MNIAVGCGLLLVLDVFTVASAREDIHQATYDIEVRRDGTNVVTSHMARSFTTDAEASRSAQYSLPFNPSLERLEIVEAFTRKTNGEVKRIDPAAIRATLAPGVSGGTMFEDVQQKVVIFPDMTVGDEQVLTVRREVFKPLFPGQFTRAFTFPASSIWRDARVTVTAPSDFPLAVETHDVIFEKTEQGDTTRYEWRHGATTARDIVTAVDRGERSPRLFMSSFKDQGEMGRAYRALAAPKEAVTPAIQAKADQIAGISANRREQAEALYNWVSKNIRYVALYLDRGGVEPHFADAVLRNGYGDCKDHVTLLAALLRAKGIESGTVIINLGNAYELSHVATLAPLNHVLTYLPEFDVYADSTMGVMPFGHLAMGELGKPAVLVGVEESRVIRTPMVTAEQNRSETITTARLGADGVMSGVTRSFGTGPTEISLRLVARMLQTTDRKVVAARQLTSIGQSGSGDFNPGEPTSIAGGASQYGTFTLDEQPGILDGDSFAPPLGLALLNRAGTPTAAPPNWAQLAESEPTPCFAGHQTEELNLSFPSDYTLRNVPPDQTRATANFDYRAHWTARPGMVTVRREFTSRVDQPLCTSVMRAEANEMMRFIRREQQTKVALVPAAEAKKAE